MSKLDHRTAAVALLAVLTVLSAAAPRPAAAAAPAPRDLMAHGSPQSYWIARVRQAAASAGDKSGPTTRTTVQSRTIAGDAKWKRIAQLQARVVSLTNRGNEVAVLLESGDWMLVWEGGSTGGSLPEDGAKLRALAGDRDELWALATARQGRPPTSRAATEPSATMPAGAPMLYELDRGQWRMVAPLPAEIPNGSDAADLSMVLHENTPLLAVLTGEGKVHVFAYQRDRRVFEPFGAAFAAPAGATRVKLLTDLGRPTLWAGDEHGTGSIFLRDRDREWSDPLPLALPADAPTQAAQADVTVAGQSIRLLLLPKPADDGGTILEYSFGPDGSARGKPVELPAPSSASSDQKPFDWFSAVAAAMLMMVLLNSLRAPRPVVDPDKLEELHIQLAPYGVRILAAAIDFIPAMAVAVALSYAWLSPQELRNLDPTNESIRWARYIAAAIYVIVAMLTEVLWGWTIGKKLCGLRVVTLDGLPPSRGAFFWRSLLRFVDIAMLFPMLLVFLSPLRQRVGDVAAETIVVVKNEGRNDEGAGMQDETNDQ